MQNGQRAQINFLEHITFVLVSTFICGLYFPTWTVILQAIIFTGRLMFSIGYTRCGPKARIPGALIMDLAILVAIGLMITACVKMGSSQEIVNTVEL